jgi:hypothetical protein
LAKREAWVGLDVGFGQRLILAIHSLASHAPADMHPEDRLFGNQAQTLYGNDEFGPQSDRFAFQPEVPVLRSARSRLS